MSALVQAIRIVNEEGFNIVHTPTFHKPLLEQFYWYVSLDNLSDYPNKKASYSYNPNAIFSTFGTWGILITDSEFAYIGGSQEFITTFFKSSELSLEGNIEKFIQQAMNYGPNENWIKPTLNHLFGDSSAEYFWAKYGR